MAQARTTDPSTSQDAAASMRGPASTALYEIIGKHAVAAGRNGVTKFDVWAAEGEQIQADSLSPRMKEMRREHKLARKRDDQGKVVRRKAGSGRSQEVHLDWSVADLGERVATEMEFPVSPPVDDSDLI